MKATLQEAIAAIRANQPARAYQLLANILRQDPTNEQAWLWMSAVVDTYEAKAMCLEKVLALNPHNAAARRGLSALRSHLGPVPATPRAEQKTVESAVVDLEEAEPAETTAPPLTPAMSTTGTAHTTGVIAPPSKKIPLIILSVMVALALVCIGGLSIWFLTSGLPSTDLSVPNPSATIATTTTRLPSSVPQPTLTPSASAKVPEATPTATRVFPPSSTRVPEATPTATRVFAVAFTPGDPTATPPGEDITDPNYLEGKIAYEAKDYEEVLRLMTLVLEANPNLAPPHWYRGMAYFYMGNYQAMLEEMEQALAIDPDYALGYADRGLAYSSLGDERRAMADWQKALSLDPTLAKVHHNIAVTYYNHGDYFRALEEYDMAVAIDPKRAISWNGRSETLMWLKRYQDCIESAGQAIDLKPDLWISYYNRGTCKAHLDQFESAIPDFDEYLDVVQDDPMGWYNRGLSHRYLGNNQQALVDYTRSIELDPTYTWALINRGNVYIDLQEYDLALADYNAALALGEIPRAYLGRGDAYYGIERYDEAITAYQQAIVLLPNFADAYGRLARVYLAQNKYQEAIDAADQASALGLSGGNESFTLQIRGRAYYGLGDYKQAISDLNEVIAIHPTVMDFYYRGIAHQANGQKQEAIQDLEYFIQQASAQNMERDEIDDAQARLAELRK